MEVVVGGPSTLLVRYLLLSAQASLSVRIKIREMSREVGGNHWHQFVPGQEPIRVAYATES